jgi:hypothetical protein
LNSKPWYASDAMKVAVAAGIIVLIVGILLERFRGDSDAEAAKVTTIPESTSSTLGLTTTEASPTTVRSPEAPPTTSSSRTSVPASSVPTRSPVVTATTLAAVQIGRVEVLPDEYARIGKTTWRASRYGNNTAAFRYGWAVYDTEGNRITRNTECRVKGIVSSSDGTPMGSRNGYCDYDVGFTGYHYLPPGSYRVTVTVTMDSGFTKDATFDFTVVPDTN